MTEVVDGVGKHRGGSVVRVGLPWQCHRGLSDVTDLRFGGWTRECGRLRGSVEDHRGIGWSCSRINNDT